MVASSFSNVGIAGVGLIGGSIELAIKKYLPDVKVALFHHPYDQERFNAFTRDLDLLIIGAPLSKTLPIAELVIPGSKPLVVIDVGSVKGFVADRFETLTQDNLEFVPTHPMAGKETLGREYAEADLFKDHPWVLVPHKKNREETLQNLEKFIKALEATPIRLGIKKHDEYAALISHIPSIISRSYLDFVTKNAPEALKIAGTGFQSFTRIGKETELRQEIESINRPLIDAFLEAWIKEFSFR
ncbi:MAG: prephenate dehydrogenase/arogenate dehydrogenase family protein [Chlamydiia bacterium]|nr:prephenate dehydrogenase/arogenate dehydrogenase family protein [Chlamydiia bacterium]